MITAILAVALVAGAVGTAAATAPTSARTPTGQTLPITVDVLIRTSVFPAESCCHWVARHSHDGFRDGTADRCETGDRILPERYGVITRQFIYRSRPSDQVILGAARSTIVKFRGARAAGQYYRQYVGDGFDCAPRHVDGGTPGGGTAVYKVVRTAPGQTVVADEGTAAGATTMRKYIDIRPVGRFVAIVEYELGEAIQYRPHLHRVTKIADAQQRRLERRLAISRPPTALD